MYGTGAATGVTAAAVTAGVGSVAYVGINTLSLALIGILAVPVGLVLMRAGAKWRSKRRGRRP